MDSAAYTPSSRFLQWEMYVGAKKEERTVEGHVCCRKWLDCDGQRELTVNEHVLCARHCIRYFHNSAPTFLQHSWHLYNVSIIFILQMRKQPQRSQKTCLRSHIKQQSVLHLALFGYTVHTLSKHMLPSWETEDLSPLYEWPIWVWQSYCIFMVPFFHLWNGLWIRSWILIQTRSCFRIRLAFSFCCW